jgi:predicted metal-dependent hydrolase
MLGSPAPLDLARRYLGGYPAAWVESVAEMIAAGRVAAWLAQRHPDPHEVRTDAALYDYTLELKQRRMRQSPPIARVAYDPKLRVLAHALGTHTAVSRVQGGKLKAKREIRVASLFREAPADMLHMIVAHELAHLREPEHDKAFYSLCEHLAPGYHALEFATRVWLLHRDVQPLAARGDPVSGAGSV